MIDFLRRVDRAVARGESWLIVATLIAMVLVAGFQAGIRNLTRFDIQWANHLLTDMEWADSFLRKGTLWLAFVGASIATYKHKHIAIDVLLRIAPLRSKYWMLAIGGILAGVITLGLTYSFWSAVKLNLTERPVEYEMLGDKGPMHICDATPEQLHAIEDMSRPTFFCAFRSVLSLFGADAETPGAAFQLIVPVMFFFIAVRTTAYGIGYIRVATGDERGIEEAEAEERARLLAQQQSVFEEGSSSEASDVKEAKS
jgi:TRAP-type C4-dicarboxylate transport system permease small subunit